jgi:DNA-binding NtrC family response regulator
MAPKPKRSLTLAREHLEELERPAILLDLQYRILGANGAYAAHYGATPRIGHDRCFAVSHGYDAPCDQRGEDCPLGRALRSLQRERAFHVHIGRDHPEHVEVELSPVLDEHGALEGFVEVIAPIEQVSAHVGGNFVGRSPAFLEVVGLMRRAAPSLVPILLMGESGTGKELCAQAIHEASDRRDGPFVPLECSGLGEALFESELFGHARGAFTGAHARKPGLVEAARGGTLFLDEIGDVPLPLQVKLLRLLETSTYRAVGDVQARTADFRLVCATHRDLSAMVAAGTFRRDLYYRINTFPIELPALRQRRQDVPLLCEVMLRNSGKTVGGEALEALCRYDFPGNVRELRNILDRAVLLSDGPVIELQHLPAHVRADAVGSAMEPAEVARDEATAGAGGLHFGGPIVPLDELERRYLKWAAGQHRGDRAELARELGLSERTLYRKLSKI